LTDFPHFTEIFDQAFFIGKTAPKVTPLYIDIYTGAPYNIPGVGFLAGTDLRLRSASCLTPMICAIEARWQRGYRFMVNAGKREY
jgi:hypothetical protein